MRKLAALATSLVLVAAGCGGDSEGTSPEGQGENSGAAAETEKAPPSEADESGTLTIRMKDIKFLPSEATVKVGQTVRWVNDDTVEHDAKATSGADFASDLFGKGGTYEWEAEEAATIVYICTVHAGMSGMLHVTG